MKPPVLPQPQVLKIIEKENSEDEEEDKYLKVNQTVIRGQLSESPVIKGSNKEKSESSPR